MDEGLKATRSKPRAVADASVPVETKGRRSDAAPRTTGRPWLLAWLWGTDRDEAPAHEARLLSGAVWRDAAVAWGGLVLLTLLVVVIGRALLLTQQGMPTGASLAWGDVFKWWFGWDAANYAMIARYGYAFSWTAAYSPLLPALEHLAHVLTGLDEQAAGGLISLLASLVGFGLFRALAERELGRAAARKALLYLAIFPAAFFLLSGFTEALFLALSVGAFLALRRGWWLRAGILVALATLTRLTGMLLLAPMLIEAVRYWSVVRHQREAGMAEPAQAAGGIGRWAAIAGALALPLLTLAGFNVYLYRQFGTFSAASQAEEAMWGKGLSAPFIGIARAGNALLRMGLEPGARQIHIVLDGAFTLLLIVLAVAAWRALPRAYGIYIVASMLLIVSTPLHNWYALASNPRYVLSVFPIFLLLGRWGDHSPTVDRLILVLSLPLLTLFTLVFAMGGWVA